MNRRAGHSRGQSLVEFALLIPIMLLIVVVGIDFGRVYLGWINLQNMSRIAANFAANNAEAWTTPDDASKQATRATYVTRIQNDARAINCTPNPNFPPVFASGTDLGDPVSVTIDCSFSVITPMISNVVGSSLLVSASAVFPVKAGVVGAVPGGAPPIPAPVAGFTASPTSGYEDLVVALTNTSQNNPTSWTWAFGDGTAPVFVQSPPPHTYRDPGTYVLRLTVSNAGGTSTVTTTITVEPMPTSGPIPEFNASPRSGYSPLGPVQFTDISSGGPTTWLWSFGDGATSMTQNPTHSYSAAGTYDVTLSVSDGTISNAQKKVGYIVVTDRPCVVPNFAGVKKNSAQSVWTGAFFTTSVAFAAGNGNYTIGVQSLPGGLANPPGGCAATITVGP